MKIERFVSAEDDISPLYTLSRTEETTCVQQVLSLFFNQFSASLYIKGVKWTYLGPNLNVLKHYFICNFKMKTTESLKTDSDLLITCFLHTRHNHPCVLNTVRLRSWHGSQNIKAKSPSTLNFPQRNLFKFEHFFFLMYFKSFVEQKQHMFQSFLIRSFLLLI